MSFIDYNFFPILFFLGWNILTTKQFSSTIYKTSDLKTWSTLPVFSLTNSIYQKTLKADLKPQKQSDGFEFVPEFRFLSENKKSIQTPQTNKKLLSAQLTEDKNISGITLLSELIKPQAYLNSKASKKKVYNIKDATKPAKWLNLVLINKRRAHYFTNYNLINNNWEKNFKSNLFDSTYRSKKKRFTFSFFPFDSKIKSMSSAIESSFNLTSLSLSWFEKSVFFKGLCSYQNNTYFWQKTQKQLNNLWFFNKVVSTQSRSSFFTIGKSTRTYNTTNFIKKRRSKIRLLLRLPIQKIYSLNKFQIALCFSKTLQLPIFFDNNYPFSLSSKNYDSMFNSVNNQLKPKVKISETEFLNNTFAEHNQEISYMDNYKNKKKDWYIKTQFLQHIAWNMKHKILNDFSDFDLQYCLYPKDDNRSTYFENLKSRNDFSEILKKTSFLKGSKFYQNHFLKIYQGSWYYENLVFPYSIITNSLAKTSSLFRVAPEKTSKLEQCKTPLIQLNKQHDHVAALPSLEYPKGLVQRQECFFGGPKKFETTSIFYNWPKTIFKQKDVVAQKKSLESKRFAMAWFYARPYNLPAARPLDNFLYWPIENSSCSCCATPSKGVYTNFESDIGVYSLAHKLSSIGFRNSNSEIDIYPFKYNDSYRYNFQNMNLSNYPLKYSLGEHNFLNNYAIPFSNSRKLLDFQNPTFSKIYAPVFQPQDLNILSLIYNSFLNVIPNRNFSSMSFFNPFSLENQSKNYSPETINFFSPYQIQPPIIDEHSYYLKDSKKTDKPFQAVSILNQNIQTRPKRFKTFKNLYDKLPINGIHANFYPWITQNAFNRWSSSNRLLTFLSDPWFLESFLEKKSQDLQALVKKKFLPTNSLNYNNHETPFYLAPLVSQKEKNSNLQLHFIEKPSCIKKPSIFFSSFRHLPYFFISETLSAKNVVLPQTNLFLGSLMNFQLKKSNKSIFNNVSLPEYYLFHNNVLKQNKKKETLKPWNGYLQQKSFSLKPLSTFIKKELGYQTSLFSKKTIRHWSKDEEKVYRKNNITSIQRNTWKIFPPLFQPLTFRFIDLNLPRTWSSELLNFSHPNINFFQCGIQKNHGKKDFLTFLTQRLLKNLFFKKHGHSSNGLMEEECTSPLLMFKKGKTYCADKNLFRLAPEKTSFFEGLPNTEANPKQSKKNTSLLKYRFPNRNNSLKNKPLSSKIKDISLSTQELRFSNEFKNEEIKEVAQREKLFESDSLTPDMFEKRQLEIKQQAESDILFQTPKWSMIQKNFFRFPIPFYFSDFFRFSAPFVNDNQTKTRSSANGFDLQALNKNNQFNTKSSLLMKDNQKNENTEFDEFAFPLTNFLSFGEYEQQWNNTEKFEKKKSLFNETSKFQNPKIIVYAEKPLLKNRTAHGPPLKNQKESISLPNYLKNITNQNYQNLYPNNLNELYSVFWILFNKTLFIYLSLHYLRKFISFLGTEYIRNLFKIFVTMKFIDGNILSIIKTFQDFNFQLNQQNVIDIKVNKQLKNIKRN